MNTCWEACYSTLDSQLLAANLSISFLIEASANKVPVNTLYHINQLKLAVADLKFVVLVCHSLSCYNCMAWDWWHILVYFVFHIRGSQVKFALEQFPMRCSSNIQCNQVSTVLTHVLWIKSRTLDNNQSSTMLW